MPLVLVVYVPNHWLLFHSEHIYSQSQLLPTFTVFQTPMGEYWGDDGTAKRCAEIQLLKLHLASLKVARANYYCCVI